ncbi:MAG: polymerase [Alphaproteobacteria bacterium]|nr:polymerase [Alphaproteobacteria bacterium]MDB5740612.1 polymerase [Alphaproteobacteria bacterium]
MNDTLSTLNWLVEAGADEAVADSPVNRLVAKASVAPIAAPAPRSPARAPTPLALDDDAIGGAQAAAGTATTLEELKVALEAFDGCALKRTATNTVFADGVASGGVMLIGEAPGRDEDRVGKPFVGRAGQLLDKMLAAIALDRKTNAYITNVINWRPPDNRDPTPEEAAACLPFLRRHIELAEPKVIILLGAVAARHVVGGTEGIMKLRGRWLEYRVGDRMVPLMPTLHPAYLLRQPAHKKLAWRDLQAVAAKMEALGLPEPGSRAN